MILETQRRLAEFVDRTTEMDRFSTVIDPNTTTPVMAVWADGGMGKSSLMAKMIHECSLRNLRKVEIIYTKGNVPDYLGIMRKCRDDLGANSFASFTDLVNYYTVPQYNLTVKVEGSVEAGNNMHLEPGAQVGNITGVIVNVRDQMFSDPRNDLNVSAGERSRKLTDKFLEHVANVAAAGVIVIFIDGAERMAEVEETSEWFWNSLIRGIAERGVTNVRFIILGRTKPKVDRYKRDLVVFNELQPLAKSDVMEYLSKRGVPPDEVAATAKTLMAAYKGLPLDIAATVDTLLESEDDQT